MTGVGLCVREVYDWLGLGKANKVDDAFGDCDTFSGVFEEVLEAVA